MHKKDVVYIYNKILFSYKKKKILSFENSINILMNLERIMFNKRFYRDGEILHDIIYMWNLKKHSETYSRMVVTRGKGGEGGENR